MVSINNTIETIYFYFSNFKYFNLIFLSYYYSKMSSTTILICYFTLIILKKLNKISFKLSYI